MKVETLKLDGVEYVVLPRADYEALTKKPAVNSKKKSQKRPTQAEIDAGDIAEVKRRLRNGKFKPLAQVVRELGLA